MSLRPVGILALALFAACGEHPPGGTRRGIRISDDRRVELSVRLCQLEAFCDGHPDFWNPDGECTIIAGDTFDLYEPPSDACLDARLDYMSCVAELWCTELERSERSVWERNLEPCQTWEEKRDALCE